MVQIVCTKCIVWKSCSILKTLFKGSAMVSGSGAENLNLVLWHQGWEQQGWFCWDRGDGDPLQSCTEWDYL